jgi:hypothetical protein
MKVAIVLVHPYKDGPGEPKLEAQADDLRVLAYAHLSHKLLAIEPGSVKLDLARDDVTVSWSDGTIVSTWQNNCFAARFTAEAEGWLFASDAEKGNTDAMAVGGVGYYDAATRTGTIIYAEREQ